MKNNESFNKFIKGWEDVNWEERRVVIQVKENIQKIQEKLLNEDGLIVLETDDKEKTLKNLDTNILEIDDIKKYGRVYLLFLYSKEI